MSGTVGPRRESIFNRFSFEFDGTSDYVDMGNPASLQITGNMSISLWFKRSSLKTSSNYVLIGKDGVNALTRAYMVQVNSVTNKVRFIIWKSATAYVCESSTVVTDDVWYHVLALNDGTDLKLYINGALETTNAGAGGTMDNGIIDFNIGRRDAGGNSGYWKGNIDEVGIWNSVINISDVWDGSGKPFDISSSNPISWWRMGEESTYSNPGGSGNWTLTDQGSGGNDGTSSGMDENNRVLDTP